MPTRYLTQTLSSSGLDSDIQVGVINLVIRTVIMERGLVVDLSTATIKQLVLKSPKGIIQIKAAIFTTDGRDGMIQYTTTSINDLNESGTWQVQAYLEMPDFVGYSTISSFLVNANL